jgi:hypothetical protein
MALSRRFVVVPLLLAVGALPVTAQRAVMITGKPQASLKEPFSRVGGVRELPGNKAIILDVQEDRLVFADFAAGSVKDIGRKGGGPGEFQRPQILLAAPGTATWVPDAMLDKVHVISPDGKISPTGLVAPQANGAPIRMQPRGIDRTGRLYIQSMPTLGTGGLISDSLWVLRWTPSTNRIDTLAKVPSGMKITASSSGRGQTMRIGSKPFASDDIWAVLPDGQLAMVRAVPYRVDIIDGKQVHAGTAVSYSPIKVTSEDRDAFRKAMSSGRPITRTFTSGGGGGGGSAPTPSVNTNMPGVPDEDFPATKPPFVGSGSVKVSPEGEIWVLRSRAASDQVPTYDIFDSAGRLTGKATLNPNSIVVGFGEGTVYVARTDPDDDLVYVERYARPAAPGGGKR